MTSELGVVRRSYPSNLEVIRFRDMAGQLCHLSTGTIDGSVLLGRVSAPMKLRVEQVRDLVCVLGRFLEQQTFADTEGAP